VKAGIIAAGHGERLRAAGIATPKPLLAIGGRPLIARAIDTARVAGATSIACIVNAETDAVRRFLLDTDFGMPVEIVQRTTASSAESFLALRSLLDAAPFLLLTVDAVVAPEAIRALVERAAAHADAAGVLGVTTLVDDEKPLWAELDNEQRIVALGDATRARHVTAGVYFLKPVVYSLADARGSSGWSAFRLLLGALLTHGHVLYGHDVGACIDVDRPEDIVAAERLLGLTDDTPPV
jgi:NDP-sugar pyrophosphorylase family protein